MKPCYTIEELANILQMPIYNVAAGLLSAGVVPFINDKPADLSQWGSRGPIRTGENEFILISGQLPDPDPERVVVNSEAFTQTWKDAISKAERQENAIGASETTGQPVFDKASPTYAPELDIAMQAWREVSTTDGKGNPKARIKTWLSANAKHLTNEARGRIAIVANWKKMGGATRTE